MNLQLLLFLRIKFLLKHINFTSILLNLLFNAQNSNFASALLIALSSCKHAELSSWSIFFASCFVKKSVFIRSKWNKSKGDFTSASQYLIQNRSKPTANRNLIEFLLVFMVLERLFCAIISTTNWTRLSSNRVNIRFYSHDWALLCREQVISKNRRFCQITIFEW